MTSFVFVAQYENNWQALGEIIRLFPECMKFVCELKPDDVINILNFTNFDPNDESHVRLKKNLVSF